MKMELAPKRNALNAIRLALALLVIVSHAPLAGWGDAPYRLGDLEIGGWAVAGFFAISGWLIVASRMHLSLGEFAWRRALRIMPAFWTVILLTAIATGSVSYLTNASLVMIHPRAGGTLWNLSLWTLAYEAACYAGVAILVSIKAPRRVFPAALALVTAAGIVQPMPVFRLASFFLAGVCAYLYREHVTIRVRTVALTVGALAVMVATGNVSTLGAVPIAYLILVAGEVLPFTKLGATNDVSYGTYLYAYPVAVALQRAGVPQFGLLVYLAATVAIVVPLAWASWLLVERPALGLKDRFRRVLSDAERKAILADLHHAAERWRDEDPPVAVSYFEYPPNDRAEWRLLGTEDA